MRIDARPKGFIQIPILIAIIVGVLAVGGGGYFGYVQIRSNSSSQPSEDDLRIAELQQQISDLEKLSGQSEDIEALKDEVATLRIKTTRLTLTNAEIINKVGPAVVYIETTEKRGSGMIIESNGYILTNAHVVEGKNTANITTSDKKIYTGSVIGRDEVIDLAIIKIIGNGFPTVDLGDSNETILKQGDPIFSVGYSYGFGEDISFKDGIISRRLTDTDGTVFLEITAEIQPGNSGGPLVDKLGQVVGINTFTYGKTGDPLKFAIPIDIAKTYIPVLKSGKNVIETPSTPSVTPIPTPTPKSTSCVKYQNYPGLYTDGTNYYYDDQCDNQTTCLPSSKNPGYYWNQTTGNYYYDAYCGQKVVAGCKKSKTYSGKFYKPGIAWYSDSECIYEYQSMACSSYPSSSEYTCTDRSDFDYKLSRCDDYRTYKITSFAHYCDELSQCENDYNEYQKKLTEYNDCTAEKEY